MKTNTLLPDGYTVRAPRPEETKLALDLLHAYDVAVYGAPDYEEEDVIDDWNRNGFDLNQDAWFVFADDGTLVGYAHLHEESADLTMHPSNQNPSIRPFLLELLENRRAEIAEQKGIQGPVHLKLWINARDAEEQEQMQNRGYEYERTFTRMQFDFDGPPPAPQLPDGITLRTFVPGQDDAAYVDVMNRAFATHYDYHGMTADEITEQTKRPDFIGELWTVAERDGEMIGVIGARNTLGTAWVRRVCTLPEARGQGVGLTLLRRLFQTAHRLGYPRIWLAVDSRNETGALALYHKAGMHAVREHERYRKQICD